MEGFIILLLIGILALPIVLLIWVKTSTSSLIAEVLIKLTALNSKVDQLSVKEREVKEENVVEEDSVTINESLLDLMVAEEKAISEDVIEESVEPEELVVEKQIAVVDVLDPIKIKKDFKESITEKPKKEKRSIEQFIGENLINKIGIGVLFLGISFFVNYAIENDWISEAGRVALGILSGGILTLLAHRIRKKYQAFSSVLVGGAMAVFYYTISTGFHEYGLFSQPVAFILMVIITAFSVLLSISYDKKALAILALIGAFSTPLMVSNGSGNYQVLFSYLLIVNAGMLVLAYFKKWNVVNILAFAFTVLLYGGWFIKTMTEMVNPPYQGALIFASLFYVLFFFMHIVNNVKEKRKFKGYEFGLMLTTTALFYSVGMSVLYLSGNIKMQGLFTVGLGVFNFLFAYPLYKRKHVDTSLVYLLIGMVLTFLSLAAPVQLSGNYITLFWATEMVLLLWLAQKSGLKFMKISSLLIMCLMLVSLLMDWQQIYFDSKGMSLMVLVNKGFITTIYSLLGILGYTRLLNKEVNNDFIKDLSNASVKLYLSITMVFLLFVVGVLEISFQINTRLDYSELMRISVLGYAYLFLLGLLTYSKRVDNEMLTQGLGVASGLLILIYPFVNNLSIALRNDYLIDGVAFWAFALQYVNLALIGLIGVQFFKSIRTNYGLRSDVGRGTVLGLAVVGLVVASLQLNHHALLFFFDQQIDNMHLINKQVTKIGYPIIWGISSFIFMIVGMKYKYRPLRVISLSLFTVILLKLFLFDIKGASEAGKIVAFILLGVLLLVISFMYQKLKNWVLDDES